MATAVVSVRLPLEVASKLSDLAAESERSLSQEVRLAVECHLAPPSPTGPGVRVS
jgi:predicted DNA-binding protein